MTVTVPDRITPDLVRRACDALVAHGCTIERHKTAAAALGTDPAQAPAYTVRRGRQVVAQAIGARQLVELAESLRVNAEALALVAERQIELQVNLVISE